MLVIGCSNSIDLAKKIANSKGAYFSKLFVDNFPDGELHIRFDCELKNKDVFLVQTLYPINEAITEVLLAAYTAIDLGARSVNLIAPYMAYMRQDKRFKPGEAISSLIVGKLFNVFDSIITIDPHLHRHKDLNEVFKTKTKVLTSNDLIENFIKKNFSDAFVIGPDGESNQWAESIANNIGLKSIVFTKKRYSSEKVSVTGKGLNGVKGKDVIIIDDIISTGHTVLEAVLDIKKFKPKSITIVGIHGIFAEKKVYDEIKKNVKRIVTTNTIDNAHSVIDVSKLIASSF